MSHVAATGSFTPPPGTSPAVARAPLDAWTILQRIEVVVSIIGGLAAILAVAMGG